MANYNCSACEDIRETAPSVVVNGLGSSECTSLKNDTGLNPSSGHNDCTDLNNLNDCLVGNMKQEVDAYEVCDWKEFMKKFIPNVWTTLKAMICAICGLWTNVHNLKEQNDAMCALIDALINPPLGRYGSLLNGYGDDHPSNKGGVIGTKSGHAVVIPRPHSEVDDAVWYSQNIGIYLGKQRMARCSDGACRSYEWVAPNMVGYRVNPEIELEVGDIVWYATKAQCTAWGMSENMWNAYELSSWTWKDYGFATNPRSLAWFRLHVNNNRLELTYQGQVGSATTNSNAIISENDNPARRYIYTCS